jgi:hypothetical protein
LTTTCWPSRLELEVPQDAVLVTPVARRLKAIATVRLASQRDRLSTLER